VVISCELPSKRRFSLSGFQFWTQSKGIVTSKAQAGSRGILDLISENGEPEVARLQMLVWNLILGVVFVWQSLFRWQMPEFDATLMTLIGISSTTYVGFRLSAQPESDKKADQPS
jgi:hypothetical protein